MNNLRTETVKINSLSLDPTNARRHDAKNLAAIAGSLKLFGQRKPIVVTGANIVVAGNGTLEAAKSLGWEEIAIVRTPIDWTPEQVKAYALADNRTAELAEWDAKVLADQLVELDAVGWDVAEFGFEPIEPPVNLEDDEPLSFEQINSRVKKNQLWQLGNHLLFCGDSTIENSYKKLLNEEVDLLITDPPYGVSYASKNDFLNNFDKGNRNQTPIENDHLDEKQVFNLWKSSFSLAEKNMKSGASYYITGPQGELISFLMTTIKESNLLLKHMLIWVKNNHVLGRSDYHYKHEPILYGWKKGSHKFYGGSSQFSVWNINKPLSSKEHPTMKPVELYVKAIENSSKKNDIVLDIFAGSGTLVLAAERTNRRARMIEFEEKYCDLIISRWEKETGLEAELLES